MTTMRNTFILAIALLLVFSLPGCKEIKYGTFQYVPVYHYDTVQQTNLKIDSVFIKDSIYVYQSGDTVKQYVYKYIYKDKFIHDTVYKHSTDTVTKIVNAPAKPTKEPFFNKFGKAIFYGLFGALLTFTGIVVCKFINM